MRDAKVRRQPPDQTRQVGDRSREGSRRVEHAGTATTQERTPTGTTINNHARPTRHANTADVARPDVPAEAADVARPNGHADIADIVLPDSRAEIAEVAGPDLLADVAGPVQQLSLTEDDQPGPTLSRADVEDAARYLEGQIVRTPVLRSPVLDRIAGARLLVKAENLQLSGSYKMRGATVAVGRLAAAGTDTGVICQSTGNHAQAVALAARRHGLAATVVLPRDAPAGKVAQARAAGARVILAGTSVEERLDVVRQVRAETGHAVIDAYDHRDVVAGQGTAALELIDAAERLGVPLDALVVPVGGGGGAAGACLAAAGRGIDVYGVEPVGCDSLAQSLAAGRRVPVPPAPTLADGLRPTCVGALPFGILRAAGARVVRVDDAAIADAFRLVLMQLKLLAEPSGAAAVAGALRIAAPGTYRTVGVVLTGGNVEAALVARLMSTTDQEGSPA